MGACGGDRYCDRGRDKCDRVRDRDQDRCRDRDRNRDNDRSSRYDLDSELTGDNYNLDLYGNNYVFDE